MKRGKFLIGMVIGAVLAGMAFMGCSKNEEKSVQTLIGEQDRIQVKPPIEKPEITYGLAPGSLKNYMAKISDDTYELVHLLREKKNDSEKLTLEDWEKRMGKTYLKNPKLTWNGNTFENLDEVISQLNAIIVESKAFDFVKAHVAFQHIPFDPKAGSEWMKINEKRPPGAQIDFIGHIHATISYNGDFTMGGALPHRLTCEPDF